MPRKKFVSDNHVAYDPTPVQLKVLPGVREQLMSVCDWRVKLRLAIQEIIANGDGD